MILFCWVCSQRIVLVRHQRWRGELYTTMLLRIMEMWMMRMCRAIPWCSMGMTSSSWLVSLQKRQDLTELLCVVEVLWMENFTLFACIFLQTMLPCRLFWSFPPQKVTFPLPYLIFFSWMYGVQSSNLIFLDLRLWCHMCLGHWRSECGVMYGNLSIERNMCSVCFDNYFVWSTYYGSV